MQPFSTNGATERFYQFAHIALHPAANPAHRMIRSETVPAARQRIELSD
jgi:hypothetical protein